MAVLPSPSTEGDEAHCECQPQADLWMANPPEETEEHERNDHVGHCRCQSSDVGKVDPSLSEEGGEYEVPHFLWVGLGVEGLAARPGKCPARPIDSLGIQAGPPFGSESVCFRTGRVSEGLGLSTLRPTTFRVAERDQDHHLGQTVGTVWALAT